MDLGTILGLGLGFGLIITAMVLGGGVMPFVDAQSALIVIFGTFAATLTNQKMPYVISGLKSAVQAFFDKSSPKADLVPLIIDLAGKARKEGLVALEGEEISDPFMARGVRLGVDGLSPELITETLKGELSAMKERHERAQQIFKFMSATAPSMGLIGTIIDLVQMLESRRSGFDRPGDGGRASHDPLRRDPRLRRVRADRLEAREPHRGRGGGEEARDRGRRIDSQG